MIEQFYMTSRRRHIDVPKLNETVAMLRFQTNRVGVEIVKAKFSKFDCVVWKKKSLKIQWIS